MITYTSFSRGRRNNVGFSLVELAIAVFIMALLVGSLLVPLNSQVESRKIDETQKILEQARDALLGYVAANGYFPCPASSASNGQEALPASPNNNHNSGTCNATVAGTNAYVGFFPAVTLGFAPVDSSGYALDAWGLQQNRIRYAVANATITGVANTPCLTTVVTPYTQLGGIRKASMGCIQSLGTLLYVCNTGTGVTGSGCSASTAELSDNAIAIVWSLGPNAPTGGSAPHEDKNLNGSRVFVMAPNSKVAGSEFDDMLIWIGPPMLFNKMISAGTLP